MTKRLCLLAGLICALPFPLQAAEGSRTGSVSPWRIDGRGALSQGGARLYRRLRQLYRRCARTYPRFPDAYPFWAGAYRRLAGGFGEIRKTFSVTPIGSGESPIGFPHPPIGSAVPARASGVSPQGSGQSPAALAGRRKPRTVCRKISRVKASRQGERPK